MRIAKIMFAVLFLVLDAIHAHAQADTFTQIGTVKCPLTVEPDQTSHFHCPGVTFPIPFGGIPQVVVSYSSQIETSRGYVGYKDELLATKIEQDGFLPVLVDPQGSNGPTSGVDISWIAVGAKKFTGTAVARYMVLTVVYAPPGTNGGHSSSSINYAAGSTTGTTTSASQSFQISNGVQVSSSATYGAYSGELGLSFDWTRSTTDTTSLDIKKSTNSTITWSGPSTDGINHDEDAIYLLLNPSLSLSLSTDGASSWALAPTAPARVQIVRVGQLNGHSSFPPGVQAELDSAGITASDYPSILSRDPFAMGSSIDPNRFVPLNTDFPYIPPYSAGGAVLSTTFSISDSSTQTYGSDVSETYKVGLSVSGGVNFLQQAKASLKDSLSWQWTNKSSNSHATGVSQTAGVTIGGPAFGYTGPTVVRVLLDKVYHTFAFVLLSPSQLHASVMGTVLNSQGKPIPGTEVKLLNGSEPYRTFTDVAGKYTFYGNISGPVTVQVGAGIATAPVVTPRVINLKLP